MRLLFQVISWLALVGLILPSVLYLAGSIKLDQVKLFMLITTLVWFIITPLWMGRQDRSASAESGEV